MSAAFGMMSSLSASFTPSASDWSRPNGPCTLGPIRCCIRATTRRSHQMLNSVSSTRITKISTALMMISHHGSLTERRQVVDHREQQLGRECGHQRVPPVAVPVIVTVLPGDARSASTPRPKELAGTQTVSGAMSASSSDLDRQGDRAAVTGEGDLCAETNGQRGGDAGDGTACGGAQRGVTVLEPAVVERLLPRRQPHAVRGRLGRFRASGERRGRRPTDPSPPSRNGPRRRCGSRAAGPSEQAQLVGDAGEHPEVGQRGGVVEHRVEGSRATLPGHEHAGLVAHRGDREHDVGGAGHLGLAQVEGDHERGGLDRGAGGSGIGRVVGVDAADDQAAELTVDQRGHDRVGVAADGLGQGVDAPGGGGVDAGGGVGDRAAAGQQVGQAAGLDAPRSPARRGTQASRAPVRWARSAAAASAPGTVASRSPTRITAPVSMP